VFIHRLARLACCFALLAGGARQATAEDAPVVEHSKSLWIVAPEKFHPALADYVAHKQKQLPTTLVSLEATLKSNEGVDDPEKLKRAFYAAWKNDKVNYFLLVGDADVFPVRYMVLDRITKPAFDYAFYPSDLYYSDLAKQDGSFDDWNGNKEGFHANYFGEVRGEANKSDPINFDGIDYRPDVAVGRWPVSIAKEVAIVASKTMTYENGVLEGQKPGLKTAALFSVGGWVDSRDVMDGAASSLTDWQIEKRYYRGGRRKQAETPPPNADELVSLMNAGLGFAIHAGHGQDNQWEQCFPLRSLDGIHNADRLPVVISAGCSTARFATLPPYEPYIDVNGQDHAGSDHGEVFTEPPPSPAVYQSGNHNPTGLGEQLLRRGADGAVAYIGCNTGSQPCGLSLVTGFARSYGESPSPRLGDCWVGAVRFYYDDQHLADLKPNDDWYPPSIFFQAMKFMVYGDPSLVLPTASSP
jgi:hypothetical protein